MASPPAPFPKAIASLDFASSFWKLLLSITLRRLTVPKLELGTSIPTADLPGMGASILMVGDANARARSLEREVILSTLTLVRETSSILSLILPFSSFSLTSLVFTSQPGSISNCVTVGPTLIWMTFASTP